MQADTGDFAHSSQHLRLRLETLVRLRWLAIAGQSAGVLFVEFVLGFPTPLVGTGVIILVAGVLNVALGLAYPQGHRLDGRSSALILAFDILQLSALLYLTGGLENPFAYLFLAPVMISATVLSPRLTIALGLLAMACATVLATWHRPLPWSPGQALTLPGAYVTGVWVSILLGIGFIGVYAWRVANEARLLAGALAATELVLTREQHLSMVDGLAAAAAHQLGSPLGTIAVVARELEKQTGPDHPFHEDIALLRTEAGRCREILAKIASLGGEKTGPHGVLTLDHLLEELVEPHRHFGVTIDVQLVGQGAIPTCARNPGVIYGIGNLVENAVDFASARVMVTATWTTERVEVRVVDDGPGFRADVLGRLGDPYVTSRSRDRDEKRGEGGGLGLGLFIARTLLERSGATVTWGNRPDTHGASVLLVWPRAQFEAR